MKAHWMLRLYPRAWRNRYEDEFRALLDDYPTTTSDLLDILLGAADAQLQFSQLPALATETEGLRPVAQEILYQQARLRVRWMAALYLNAALFVFVNVLLLGINLLTNPDTLWVIYPLWGWSMLLTLHAASVLRGRALFGAHATLFAVLNAGLLWINLSTSDVYWFHWPLINTAILLLAHALVAFNVTGYFGAHVTVSALVIAELAYIAVADVPGRSESQTWVLWSMTSVLTLLLFHGLVRFRNVTWLAAHAVLFVVFNIQFALLDFTQSDERWFHYPLLAWAVVLAAHIGVKAGVLPSFDSEWQTRKQRELMQRAALEHGVADNPADLDAHAGVYARRAGELRVLNLHLFIYLVGAVVLILLNTLTWSSTAWALWPLWGWGIVLAAHAGYIHFQRSWLGAHAALYLLVNAGLFTIDVLFSDSRWFFWPLAGSNLVLLVHIALSRDVRRAVRAWEQRRIASMLE